MVKKNVLELWSTIKERLSPPDLKTLISLFKDFNHRRIEKTQLTTSALLLFKNDEFLRRCFTDFLHGKKSQKEQEDEDGETQNDEDTNIKEGEIRERDPKTEVYVHNKESTTKTKESERKLEEAIAYDVGQDVEICKTVVKTYSEKLSLSEFLELTSLIENYDKKKIRHREFRKSLPLLGENKGQEDEHGKTQQNVEDTDLEEGEIRENHVLAIRARVDEISKEYHGDLKIGADVGIRVKVDKNPKEEVSNERKSEKYVTDVFDKMNLEGKKRRIFLLDRTIERYLKKPRKSRRLDRVTPSYKLIPEEEQCPVKCTVLNNKCSLMKFDDASGHKKLTKWEEAMARCEDEMFEADMLIERLRSALDIADKVLEGEMKVEHLGVLFYKCIQKLFREDMFEAVREDHKKALPVIILRLKQKLDYLTVARERLKPRWKQVFKENTANQRDSTAKGLRRKLKAKQQI